MSYKVIGDRTVERITITLETGSAAFEETPASEIARILRELAEDLEDGNVENRPIRDRDGKVCGALTVAPD